MEDISKHSVHLNKFQEIFLTWSHTGLIVRTDKQVHYYRFSYNLSCIDKQLDYLVSILNVPLSSPASKVFAASKFIKAGLSGMDLSQLITDSALWPYNMNVLEEMANFTGVEWSPCNFSNTTDKVIAILNNVGSVEFYKRSRMTWSCVLNLSSFVNEEFKETAQIIPVNVQTLKEVVYVLESCCMCWGSNLNEDGSVFFVTAQKHGVILFWVLKYKENNIDAKCCGKINTEIDEIVSMLWIPKGSRFLLICSTILGEIIGYDCIIENQIVNLNKKITLWSYKDRMLAIYLNFTVVENHIVFICNKNRHLLVQMLSNDSEVISQFVENINDYKISGITNCNNVFYMSTVNSKLYNFICNVKDSVLNVKLEEIKLNNISPTFELQGVSFSKNGIIGALAFIDRRIMHRKEQVSIDLIFLSQKNSECTALTVLLENPSKKLTDYWDCIELLRCRIMKTKTLPTIDYNQLFLDGETDVYKLKMYLIILQLYYVLKDNIKIYKIDLPELSIEFVKNKILLKHFSNFVQNLHSKYLSNGSLNEFEKECFVGARTYLNFYCQENKINIDNVLQSDILKIVTEKFEYTCQCCDDQIEGVSCANEHLNMFCLYTFTPIKGDDYLTCESCSMLARFELYDDHPMCIFCDLFLENNCIK